MDTWQCLEGNVCYMLHVGLYKNPAVVLRLWKIYFAWLVREADIELAHVSTSVSPVSLLIVGKSKDSFSSDRPQRSLLGSLQHHLFYSNDSWFARKDMVSVKKRGTVILADYSIKVRELTLLGHILYFLNLLPPLVAYAYGRKLRILSKINWIKDNSGYQAAFHEKGFISSVESKYIPELASPFKFLYPFYWISITISFFAALLQFYAKVIDYVMIRLIDLFQRFHYISIASYILRAHDLFNSHVPVNFKSEIKLVLGCFVVSLARLLERSGGKIADLQRRRQSQ
jgi:hypothetical protein